MSQRGPEGDLRDFLRTRRARITPEQAGLTPFPGVRRVPGLRREEVAQLAGVSVDYYVRLERGRSESVSTGVLNAVARALQLDDTERENLFALARQRRRQSRSKDVPEQVRPGLVHTLRNITEVPALLLGHRLDVLAANDLARCLYLDFDGETNIACYMFLHDAARDLYIDWPETALEIVGMLRLSSSNHPRDTRLAGLVDDLSAADKDFRRLW
jgi:transcriptional regulator with XRE-family HTH domain